MAKTFQIGGRVKVIDDTHAYTRNVGRVGTIIDLDADIYRVRFDDSLGSDLIDTTYANDLELVVIPVEEVVVKSVKEQIEAIEAALAVLKSTIGI